PDEPTERMLSPSWSSVTTRRTPAISISRVTGRVSFCMSRLLPDVGILSGQGRRGQTAARTKEEPVMRRIQWPRLFLALATSGPAAANEKEAQAIIERAIKAQGGADGLTKAQVCRRTDTGKQALGAVETPLVSQVTRSLPDRVRLQIEVDKGTKITIVLDGDKGWQRQGSAPPVQLPST